MPTIRAAEVAWAATLALSLLTGCSKDGDGAAARETPSGLPVPRYVTLKFDEVNARAAPSDDARLLFVYRAKRLPVQVLAETTEWRRVCDPQGRLVWVHRRTTDGRRTVLARGRTQLALHERPEEASPVKALLRPDALAGFSKCEAGWCKLEAGGAEGWAQETQVWGVDDAPQCKGLTAADVVERGAVVQP